MGQLGDKRSYMPSVPEHVWEGHFCCQERVESVAAILPTPHISWCSVPAAFGNWVALLEQIHHFSIALGQILGPVHLLGQASDYKQNGWLALLASGVGGRPCLLLRLKW